MSMLKFCQINIQATKVLVTKVLSRAQTAGAGPSGHRRLATTSDSLERRPDSRNMTQRVVRKLLSYNKWFACQTTASCRMHNAADLNDQIMRFDGPRSVCFHFHRLTMIVIFVYFGRYFLHTNLQHRKIHSVLRLNTSTDEQQPEIRLRGRSRTAARDIVGIACEGGIICEFAS